MLKLLSVSSIKLDKVLGTLIYLLQRQLRDVITEDAKTFWCKGLIWMILRRIKHKILQGEDTWVQSSHWKYGNMLISEVQQREIVMSFKCAIIRTP